MSQAERLAEQFISMSRAIQRVRDLHIQESEITTFCKECLYMYPCDTIKALDGEIGSVEPVKFVALDGDTNEQE